MKSRRRFIWPVAAVLVSLLVTVFTFYNLVRYPAHTLHDLGGDGVKNYFSYIYHISYGNGWWFNGMNYPYGEHIMFVDGQPILTLSLIFLREYITLTPATLTAILNIILTFTFFLSILFIYRILLKFELPNVWAILFACLIAVMATNNFYLFGGYGLSYVCIIPITFYCFICYNGTGRKKYMAYLFLLSVIVMFLHPYQFALILVWSGLYILGYSLLNSSSGKQKIKHLLPILFVVVTAIVVLKATIALTDPVTDRPDHPYGLLQYCTPVAGIFTHEHSPYWSLLRDKGIIKTVAGNISGIAYTGIVAISLLCVSMCYMIYSYVRKRQYMGISGAGFQGVWLFIAIGALLFSMGVPFILNMEWVYDYISSFRQFRSLSWFALIFYHIVAVYAAVVLYSTYRRYRATGRYVLAGTLFFLPVLVWGYEAYRIAGTLRGRQDTVMYNYAMFYSWNEENWSEVLAENGYSAGDFQGIIFLPYYHLGSEKIWLTESGWGISIAMKVAYQLHLPLVNAMMSRSSWQQTFKQIKIAGGPYTYKSLLHEVEDERPYLLLRYQLDELKGEERYLVDMADSIGRASNLVGYAVTPGKIRKSDEIIAARATAIGKSMTAGDTSLGRMNYYYQHFDDAGNKDIFFGEGAEKPVTHKDTVIARIDVSNWHRDRLYECSAWFLVNDKNFRMPSLVFRLFDSAGAVLTDTYMPASASNDTHGWWFRVSMFFNLPASCSTIQLSLNERRQDSYYGLDEVLIRQAEDTIISKAEDGRILANNHLLSQ